MPKKKDKVIDEDRQRRKELLEQKKALRRAAKQQQQQQREKEEAEEEEAAVVSKNDDPHNNNGNDDNTKMQQQHEHEHERYLNILDLPDDAMRVIMSMLPATDFGCFISSSKTLQLLLRSTAAVRISYILSRLKTTTKVIIVPTSSTIQQQQQQEQSKSKQLIHNNLSLCITPSEAYQIIEDSYGGGNTGRMIVNNNKNNNKKKKKQQQQEDIAMMIPNEFISYAKYIEEAVCGYSTLRTAARTRKKNRSISNSNIEEIFLPRFVQGRFASCSPEHSLCRISGDCMYHTSAGSGIASWGVGKRGQLGHGKRQDEKYPKRMIGNNNNTSTKHQHPNYSGGGGAVGGPLSFGYGLNGIRIVQVSAGGGLVRVAHSLLLTDTGHVLSFGTGQYGALGHGYSAAKQLPDVLVPKYIHALKDVQVICISAGELHSGVVTNDGDVYTWGDGFCGQLGHANKRPQLLPKQVIQGGIQDEIVITISCGSRHTIVTTDEGHVYTFGLGHFGVLGRSYTPFDYDADAAVVAFTGTAGGNGVNENGGAGDDDNDNDEVVGNGNGNELVRNGNGNDGAFFDANAGHNNNNNNDGNNNGVDPSPLVTPVVAAAAMPVEAAAQPQPGGATGDNFVDEFPAVIAQAVTATTAASTQLTAQRHAEREEQENREREVSGTTTTGRNDSGNDDNDADTGGGDDNDDASSSSSSPPHVREMDADLMAHLDLIANLSLDDSSTQCIPMIIDSLANKVHIIGSSAGHRHSLFLSDTGDIYSCGAGGSGCLGHGDTQSQMYPVRINAFDDVQIQQDNDDQFNDTKISNEIADQKDNNNSKNKKKREQQQDATITIVGTKIRQMSAGVDFSMAVDVYGNVYGWGKTDGGRNGLGGFHTTTSATASAQAPRPARGQYVTIPRRVDMSRISNHDDDDNNDAGAKNGKKEKNSTTTVKAVDVECGYVHSIIVGLDGTIHVCGGVGVDGEADGQQQEEDIVSSRRALGDGNDNDVDDADLRTMSSSNDIQQQSSSYLRLGKPRQVPDFNIWHRTPEPKDEDQEVKRVPYKKYGKYEVKGRSKMMNNNNNNE